jgi:hypothetical protein
MLGFCNLTSEYSIISSLVLKVAAPSDVHQVGYKGSSAARHCRLLTYDALLEEAEMSRRAASRKPGWSSDMVRGRTLEGRQVKCLTADEGHVWMYRFDSLPRAVRRRLAESRFNICPACMAIDARKVAPTARPSIATYFAVIEQIERQLDKQIMQDERP